jgi:solute:Na+ symporter, SSS family
LNIPGHFKSWLFFPIFGVAEKSINRIYMTPFSLILIICGYFLLIFSISYFTGKGASNATFFTGNRNSKWYLVSFGMIGASLSGVTFISVPGWVISSQFSYLQMVLGFLFGYIVIANVLLPLYYRLGLTSIYTYLGQRFGNSSYKTGAWCFLVSRTIGASFRLFLMANVLQAVIFDYYHVPYVVTVSITILLIWLYTFKGGIRTVVYTDVLQTFFMLTAVGLTIYFIAGHMDLNFKELVSAIDQSEYSKIFFWGDFKGNNLHFVKQFIGGMFITIVMTGMDQDMMQKNLTCRNIKEAKRNVYSYGAAFLPVNLVFLSLGVLLFLFAAQQNIPIPGQTDELYPIVATSGFLPPLVTVLFMLGLVAAAYSSADSALTSLTTSVTIDIFDGSKLDEKRLKKLRVKVHVLMSLVLLVIILLFRLLSDENVVSALYTAATYTYGPLLGIFAFGLFTHWQIREKWMPVVAVLSPALTFFINKYSTVLLNGYTFGFELLLLNGTITMLGMALIIKGKVSK